APVTFFVREDADWMISGRKESAGDLRRLSEVARQVAQYLKERGASFFPDIVRGTRHLKAEVEAGLWELVAAGMITSDGFDNLRALVDPKRRAGQGSGRTARPRDSAGRWSLLYPELHSDQKEDRGRVLEAVCWMLLGRYGVVFREVLLR